MKKNIFLSILFFAVGFLTHSFFFPDVLVNSMADIKQVAGTNEVATNTTEDTNPLFTKITFDGKRFSKHTVTIGFTRYVQIVNGNEDTLMWLLSNTPELTTTRGYGHLEAVQMQFNKKGQYVVVNKNDPEEKLVITVK